MEEVGPAPSFCPPYWSSEKVNARYHATYPTHELMKGLERIIYGLNLTCLILAMLVLIHLWRFPISRQLKKEGQVEV